MAGSVLAADRFVIGYVTKTLINDPFQVLMANAAKEAGEARGAEVLLYGGSGQAAIEEEMTIVENLIAQDVDGIVLNPLDARALIPAVRKINQAGIPLVLIDNSIADGEYITYIATDNVRGAALAAEYIAMLLNGEGKVAMIEGEPGGQAANDRRKGFHDFMATVPGIEIVSSLTGHWTTEGAISATEAILQAHPDVQAIFACADMMAVGVAQVLSRANREDVILVSFDGIEEGLDLVKQGKSAGDIAQFPTTIGSMSVDILLDVLSGEKDAADYPKYMDSGTALITKYTVDAFAEEVLGIK
jgi:ribose transport system substrate-binding protein